MGQFQVIAFYKYADIENAENFMREHKEFCAGLGTKGRVLISSEGINGSISGTKGQVDKYKEKLRNDARFSDIMFKEDEVSEVAFNKMVVKLKREIIKFDQDVDWRKAGRHVSPKEFLEIYESGRAGEDFIVLDARNNYESRVGKFKEALTPNIEKFSDFPQAVENLGEHKDKKILMYCTGGIRCEKASAYLLKEGFKDVSQLHGGIINFGKEFPDSIWEGKCFVFDKRLITDINSSKDSLLGCEICGKECDFYRDCKNPECNKFTVMCSSCKEKMKSCCSGECLKKYNFWIKEKEIKSRSKNLAVCS